MSSLLLQIGLTNAALAILIAVFALVISRWIKNAQLHAVLWLVALIKLVTPPMLPYTIQVGAAVPDVSVSNSTTATETSVAPTPPGSRTAKQLSEPHHAVATQESQMASTKTGTLSADSARSAVAAPKFSATRLVLTTVPRGADVAVAIWLTGALLTLSLLIASGFRFSRLIARAGALNAEEEMATAFARLCERMRLKRAPRLVVVDAEISPLIWSWFGKSSLLFPKALARTLNREQQSMILAHELAHLRRWDQQVRWLEALIQSLYWWFPLVTWMRGKLHAAQERCCDEWVDSYFPAQRAEYCETLVSAATWLVNARKSPIWASEFGRSPDLKKRIESLLQQGTSKPLTRRAWILVGLPILLFLAFSVRWATAGIPERSSHPGGRNAILGNGPTIALSGAGRMDGYLLFCHGEIRSLSLRTGKETVLRSAPSPDSDKLGDVHSLSGPDDAGRIAYIEDRAFYSTPEKDQRFVLKTMRLDGTAEAAIFSRPGNALWASSAAGHGEIGEYLALSPTGGHVILLTQIAERDVRKPTFWHGRELMLQGTLEGWDIDHKVQLPLKATALNEPMSWFPDGKQIAYIALVARSGISNAAVRLDEFAKGDYAGDWDQLPAIHILNVETGQSSFFCLGWRAIVSADGTALFAGGMVPILSAKGKMEYSASGAPLVRLDWKRIDLATHAVTDVKIPNAAGTLLNAFAAPTDDEMVFWGHQESGGSIKRVTTGSFSVGSPMLSIKSVTLSSGQARMLVPVIDPRAKISFGRILAKD